MEKKMTKKEMFAQIKAVLTDEEQIAFIDHEIELLEKKAGAKKKPTANQIANEGIKETILTVLDGSDGMTASEVLASHVDFNGLTNQKISALLKQLKDDHKVIKFMDKKKALFKLA